MLAQGLVSRGHSSEISVVGLAEVLRILGRARQLFRQLLDDVDRERPDGAVLVDFPDFNLRLAKQLSERGIPVVYYISPQVWAWRRRRVRAIARDVRSMLVLFPFERAFYERQGVRVQHVGHPLVDEVPVLPQIWEREQGRPQNPVVALLPGSRNSEIRSLLPPMLDAVARLRRSGTAVAVRLIQAATVDRELVERLLEQSAVERQDVEVCRRDRFQVIADSHLALCASGTATLEVGLIGTPLLVAYRVNDWTYRLGRLLVKVPYISLVNLVLEEAAVPELIQDQASGEHLAEQAQRLLLDRAEIDAMRARLARLREALGERGATTRAARAVAQSLGLPLAEADVGHRPEVAS